MRKNYRAEILSKIEAAQSRIDKEQAKIYEYQDELEKADKDYLYRSFTKSGLTFDKVIEVFEKKTEQSEQPKTAVPTPKPPVTSAPSAKENENEKH